jgi:hypothetical protein
MPDAADDQWMIGTLSAGATFIVRPPTSAVHPQPPLRRADEPVRTLALLYHRYQADGEN